MPEVLTKSVMISMAIKAVKKVMPSYVSVQMDPRKQEEYDKWIKVIRWLESLREE